MKILITGASGFIGKNFLRGSKYRKEKIDALYFSDTNFENFLAENDIKATAIKCDLTSETEVSQALGNKDKYDVCLYLAANSDPRYSVTNPREDLNRNVIALLNVLQTIKCKQFIFFSSGAVYHQLKGLVSPRSKLCPGLPYSISKLTCEKYIKFFRTRESIDSYIILRFFGAFGPHEPERKITSRLIKQIIINKERSYTIYGNGKNLIDLMYIDDTISGIDAVIKSKEKDLVVDFGSGNSITITDLIKKFSSIFKKNVKIIKQGHSEENILFRISNKEFCKRFRFKFRVSVEDGLGKLMKHLAK